MLSTEERNKLVSRLDGEPVTPLGAVLKCAAGILVLVVIAAGPWIFLSASGPMAVAGAGEHADLWTERAPRPGYRAIE
jgi:hypothetical protein